MMCSIGAIYSPEGLAPYDFVRVARMREEPSMVSRGPDGFDLYSDPRICVGFNWLATVDTKAPQPFTAGEWTVWLNGCIYDHMELRKGLAHDFMTQSDAETLTALIAHLGVHEAIRKINGMFAILAFNHQTGEAFACRDRYGIKNLYVAHNENGVMLASTIDGLIAGIDFELKPCPESISHWLSFQNIFMADATMFDRIHQLQPASITNLQTGACDVFWEWDFSPRYKGSYQDAVAEIQALLMKAVERQSQTPRKRAVWMSGGMDSSAIARFMDGDFKALCAGFEQGDESCHARLMASSIGKGVTVECMTHSAMITRSGHAVRALGDLRVGPCWSNHVLYDITSKMSTIVFSGAGGDELWGGYSWRYRATNYRQIIERTPGLSREVPTFDFSALEGIDIYDRYAWDAMTFLPGVLHVGDKLSGAFGLEERVPMLDNDLVEFATSLPSEWKLDRKIYREAMTPYLPSEIIWRDKRGFTSPDIHYMSQMPNLVPWMIRDSGIGRYIDKNLAGNADALKQYLKDHPAGNWSLMALGHWFKKYFDGKNM